MEGSRDSFVKLRQEDFDHKVLQNRTERPNLILETGRYNALGSIDEGECRLEECRDIEGVGSNQIPVFRREAVFCRRITLHYRLRVLQCDQTRYRSLQDLLQRVEVLFMASSVGINKFEQLLRSALSDHNTLFVYPLQACHLG